MLSAPSFPAVPRGPISPDGPTNVPISSNVLPVNTCKFRLITYASPLIHVSTSGKSNMDNSLPFTRMAPGVMDPIVEPVGRSIFPLADETTALPM